MTRYRYLESIRENKQRPAVWMPQLSELKEGHSKLFNACSRFKTLPHFPQLFSSFSYSDSDQIDNKEIHSVAGLVPFREWRYFESQLQLFVELDLYLTLYHNGSEEFFPEPTDVVMNGHAQLHDLIRIHGGKTMLAQKLDMKFAWNTCDADVDNTTIVNQASPIMHRGILSSSRYLSWGPFSVRFAVQLLHFIRSQYLLLNPPLSCAHISMPSEGDLIRCGHDDLAAQVTRYGGYENVARKLGLQFFDEQSQQMEERSFRGAKLLWRNRHDKALVSNSEDENMNRTKRKGFAWDEDLVVRDL
jgi:hypothetical protein